MLSIIRSLIGLMVLVLLLPTRGAAQGTPSTEELIRLAEQLQIAVNANDWKSAAKLSAALRTAVTDARNRSFARATTEQVDAILRWLPEDTETVLVAQESFAIQLPHPNMEHGSLTNARGYSLGLLAAANDGKLLHALQGRTLRFVLLAARMFANHPPGPHGNLPLGLIAYQGCAVYAFAQPLSDVEFFQQSDSVVAGKPVTLARGMQRDRLSDADQEDTYLLTLLQPDTILECNNRGFFESFITGMTRPSGPLAFPLGAPVWRELDRSTPVWALRRFLPERAGLDPSHPHSPHGGMMGFEDRGATGFVLQIRPDENVTGRWLSNGGRDPWQRLAASPGLDGKATSHRQANGIWELEIQGGGSAGGTALFVLMGVLGFVALI